LDRSGNNQLPTGGESQAAGERQAASQPDGGRI